jgi:hypothetical protein
LFQASMTIAGGIATVNSVTRAGNYAVNPTLSGEPVTGVAGCGTQPTVNLTMGVLTLGVSGTSQVGLYPAVPSLVASATVGATTGSESGLTLSVMFAPFAAGVYPVDQTPGLGSGSPVWDVAYGYGALASEQTGVENTALGWGTLNANTTGRFNTAVGGSALWNEVAGTYNTIIGNDAARNFSGRNYATGVGRDALRNTLGNRNTGIGQRALGGDQGYSPTDPPAGIVVNDMTAMGVDALDNTLMAPTAPAAWVGGGTLYTLPTYVTASGNVYINVATCNAGGSIPTGTGTNISDGGCLWNFVVAGTAGAFQDIAIGNYALDSITAGSNNIGIGYSASSSLTTGSNNISIGSSAGFNHSTGNSNLAIGYQALYFNTVNSFNTAIGNYALQNYTAGYLTAVGFKALSSITSNTNASAFGYAALQNATGGNNSAYGVNAGLNITTGNFNFIAGNNVLKNTVGSSNSNTVVGEGALPGNATTAPTVNFDIAIGTNAMGNASMTGTVGSDIAIGVGSMVAITGGGNQNVAIGSNTLAALQTGTNNVALGYQVGKTTLQTGNFNIYLGTSSSCDAASAGESSTFRLCLTSGSTPLLLGNLLGASPELTVGGPLQLASYTVATLPTCAAGYAGAIAYVTDANAPTYNATLTGSSTTKTLAMCNGTNWTAH